MDLKIALLVGLVVGLIAAAIWLWPSPVPILVPTAEITVEDATGQWTIGLQESSDLILETAAVLPRIQIGHAATSSLVSPLQSSIELVEAASDVVPRILVEYASTASPNPLAETEDFTITTSPRILVEHAATVAPLTPVAESELLAKDAQRVAHKLVIENAETINIRTLEPLPSE